MNVKQLGQFRQLQKEYKLLQRKEIKREKLAQEGQKLRDLKHKVSDLKYGKYKRAFGELKQGFSGIGSQLQMVRSHINPEAMTKVDLAFKPKKSSVKKSESIFDGNFGW